jgi:hypothetical protein
MLTRRLAFVARNDVKVQMKYRLPRCRFVELRNAHPVGVEGFANAERDMMGRFDQLSQNLRLRIE